MSSYGFGNNLIKIRYVDLKSGIWKKTLVFVGDIPEYIEKELKKIENGTKYNANVLKKFYGSKWQSILGLNIYEGGNENEDEGNENEDEGNNENDRILTGGDIKNDQLIDDKTGDTKEDIKEDIKDGDTTESGNVDDANNELDVIEDNLYDQSVIDQVKGIIEDEKVITDAQKDDIFSEEKNIQQKFKHGGTIKFITEVMLYSADKILEFKWKIFLVTGIPIYRQHLWFKFKTKSYPCSYSVVIDKHIETIDIAKISKAFQSNEAKLIEGIPVDPYYFENKDFLQIHAEDTFNLLGTNYEKYGTSEYLLADLGDIIDTQEIYSKTKKNEFQLDMIYYGFVVLYFPMITYQFFFEYLRNEKHLADIYPDLAKHSSQIKSVLAYEEKISNIAYQYKELKSIATNIYSSISSTIVNVTNSSQDVETLLSLRDLFDLIELDQYICYCKANIIHEGKNVILRKTYMNEPEPKDTISTGSLLLKIRTNLETNENMRLVFFKNGGFNIRTDWREETHMTFGKIVSAVAENVNPIIKLINTSISKVKYYNINLVQVTKYNVSFTDTSLVFYYNDDVTESRFNIFRSVLEDFVHAEILIQKDTISNLSNSQEFFFRKGMYKFASSRIEKNVYLSNYYDYLANQNIKQKWETLFVKTRIFGIAHISSKIRITINGISDDTELSIFNMYLVALFKIYSDSASKIKVMLDETIRIKSKKTLKNLKNQDPVLYDFKKIYKSNIVYSKICQKPYQPLILSDEEYKSLPKEKKQKAIKYWNFTKNQPTWYSCPNAKFPHIKFLIKIHPRDYCIPCCKKVEMNENVNIKKQQIHSQCLTRHIFEGEKVKITKGSHYIASYGKTIDIGRISRLPENTLEPLFFDTYSPTGSIDQECVTSDGYYLFGVEQNTPNISNIGMLFVLAHAIDRPVEELLTDCATKIRQNPDKFRILNNGTVGISFDSVDELSQIVKNLTNENFVLELRYEKFDWNAFFMSVAFHFYGISVIYFEDSQKEFIDMMLPKNIKSADEMFLESHKCLVVLKHSKKFYPIYLFNTEIFKRTGIIDTKIFTNDSGLIAIIHAVVSKSLENFEESYRGFDMNALKKTNFKHLAYYINYTNLCYGVIVETKSGKVYLPIVESNYKITAQNTQLIYTSYTGKNNGDIKTIFNIVEKAMGETPRISNWLKFGKKIIGFSAYGLQFYISATDLMTVQKLVKNLPVVTLLYDPFYSNEIIEKVKTGKLQIGELPEIVSETARDVYDYYNYQLILLHFIDYFNKQRNTQVRAKIIKLVVKIEMKDALEKIKDFISEISNDEDAAKLKAIFRRYIVIHHDKKQLIDDINHAYFDFDKIELERIKTLPNQKIQKELMEIAKKFVSFGKLKKATADFPNMFAVCKQTNEYCQNTKLIVQKDTLESVIELLAHDITNPAKISWLFNSIFIQKSILFFKFISRKNESITIEMIE